MKSANRALVLVSLAVLSLAACQPHTELEPVAESGISAADNEVIREMSGVRIVVDGDAWTGDPEVPDLVTAVKMDITNDSGKELRIRYPNFALLGAYDRYSVLPVFGFERSGDEVMLIEGYAPVVEPEFSYEEFYVDRYYADAYPEFATYPHSLVLDERYHDRYATTWNELPLPTEEMLRWALPEGVLPSGSSLSGFLFFEGLHPGEERVNFLAQLQEASTDDYFGAVMIPLEPEGPLEP